MSNSSHRANIDASEKFAEGVTPNQNQRTTIPLEELGLGLMLGELVKRWRKKNGYTLEDVAAEIGTSKGHLSDMERGKKPLSSRWITKIAERYGVPHSDIIGSITPPPEPPQKDPLEQAFSVFSDLTEEAQADILALMRHMPKRPKEGE